MIEEFSVIRDKKPEKKKSWRDRLKGIAKSSSNKTAMSA